MTITADALLFSVLCVLCSHPQMTQRLDMYAKELSEAVKPDYEPPVVKEK